MDLTEAARRLVDHGTPVDAVFPLLQTVAASDLAREQKVTIVNALLGDHRQQVQSWAALFARFMGDHSTTPILEELVGVRRYRDALSSFAALAGKAALPQVLRHLQSPNCWDRSNGVGAAGLLPEPWATELLQNVLSKERDVSIAREAAYGLAGRGIDEGASFIVPDLDSESRPMRIKGAVSLAGLGDRRGLKSLQELLDSELEMLPGERWLLCCFVRLQLRLEGEESEILHQARSWTATRLHDQGSAETAAEPARGRCPR